MGKPVVIVEYDPGWPGEFEAEKARILEAIGPAVVAIEHVGSTAVPGLAAKPVIDIQVGIATLDDAPPLIAPLAAQGYVYVPEYEAQLPNRRYFYRSTPAGHSHHLHMAAYGGPDWWPRMRFRDYLRTHSEAAREYAALKQELAARFRDDRDAYTEAKSDFILSIVNRGPE